MVRPVIGGRVGDDRIGVGTEVDVEDQAIKLAGVISADVLDVVAEGEVGGMTGVHRPSRAPVVARGVGFPLRDTVLLAGLMCGSLCAAPGLAVGVGLSQAGLRNGVSHIVQAAR